MKVFISWSGNKSHRVALVFRDWLPSVIQSIEPYVSSEDIDKGARWSTDIAKELEDSTFGILCVTKENMEAPWLSFEAGALSKTMDSSFVSPFLFDIKRSEVKGPILQFQSTIFQKEDIKKLLCTLNKACAEGSIPDGRLNKAFEVWYPTLEEELNKIKDVQEESDDEKDQNNAISHSSEILEEILDLSRNNQRLLRNPDTKIHESIEDLKNITKEQINRFDRSEMNIRRMSRRLKPMFIEELLHISLKESKNSYGFLIVLSFFKQDFPWIYDAGKELLDILKSKVSKDVKMEAIHDFKRMIEFTFEHPIMRESYVNQKEYMMYIKEIPYILSRYVDEVVEYQLK
ncbi:TIR domain-containing protein [Dysgonomonas capnocytophagoides]|uniref:TIR domain-containing protein n=1 Tax=Dysgonomonas capnocytophagoides TaxID=45254 RepID=A0A4Y8L7F2_9BACT|nr:TIR domain-containing protein [Dysgonomonas capnocytophagoides]TFD96426.1 TIR domain-containing protein [Dysgonomonas capnocytophagoides]